MERLLEVLVPTVGACALLSVDAGAGSVAMYRQDRQPLRQLEDLALLPPTLRRAMTEVQSGGYALEVRVDAGRQQSLARRACGSRT